ncbi:MAG TPA: hypothetical protein VF950_00055 [Planctomycetota bacterium]
MRRFLLSIAAAALLALPAVAQSVRVTLSDGRAFEGELESFENGRYKIRLADGSVREVEERSVKDIVLLERADRRADPSPALQARLAFERGDFDTVLRYSAQALHAIENERAALSELSRKAGQALIERSLERRDAAGLGDHLRRLVPGLTPEARQALLTQLAGRFSDLHKSSPEEGFTTSFAEVLAKLADEGAIHADARAPLADVFLRLAESAVQREEWSQAVTLYQGAAKVDPKRKEALKAPSAAATLALGNRRLKTGDAAGALAAAQEVLALDAKSVEARRLVEDADFAKLKQELDVDYGMEAARLLKEFIARTARAEHRAWATESLRTRAGAAPGEIRAPDVAAQMRKYFPVRPGRWVLYRRADGETQERIRTESVAREGDVLKVYCLLQQIYRDHKDEKTYAVEVERDAVMLPTGGEREPLLRFPVRPGDAWSWTSRGREFRRVVKSLGETVRTGDGPTEKNWTDCLIVDFTSALDRDGTPITLTSRSTYAPGVGLVKLEFLDAEFKRFGLELVGHGIE